MAGYPTTSSKVDGTVSTKNKKHKSQAMRDFEAQIILTILLTAMLTVAGLIIIDLILPFNSEVLSVFMIPAVAATSVVIFLIMRYVLKVNGGMIEYIDVSPSTSASSSLFETGETAHAPTETFPAANGGSGLMETEIGWYRNP